MRLKHTLHWGKNIAMTQTDISDFLKRSGIMTMRQLGMQKRRNIVWWLEDINGTKDKLFQVFKFTMFAG